MTGVQQTGERVEALIAALSGSADPAAAGAAEELVGLLVGLYGDGLAQIVAVLGSHGEAGAQLLDALTRDPLVASLLVLHDLHPLSTDERIQQALDQVRPYLGSHAGGVQYLGVTDGVARLRLEGSCHGCPSSTVTVRLAIETAVRDAAPEVTEVVVDGMTEPSKPALLQIGPAPSGAPGPAAGRGAGWVTLPALGPPSARPVTVSADGVTVLLCSVRGTLYAYRDACARCGSPLGDGTLDREVLACPSCASRYNVRLAGQPLDAAGQPDPTAAHLDPLPLLADSQGARVALPEAIRA
jgi:Fe-S cluster biogenesis protein NfuA/nitrite reductase/ring-hydroxylating ferredoxin subunit